MKLKFWNPGTGQWIVLLLLGLLLAVASLPASHKETSAWKKETIDDQGNGIFEKKLERILAGVEGIGKVRVMVMTNEKKTAGTLYTEGTSEVTGVLVAAQGGDQPVMVKEIQEAVQALFQIDAHKIKVMKLK